MFRGLGLGPKLWVLDIGSTPIKFFDWETISANTIDINWYKIFDDMRYKENIAIYKDLFNLIIINVMSMFGKYLLPKIVNWRPRVAGWFNQPKNINWFDSCVKSYFTEMMFGKTNRGKYVKK